jgi:DNA-binding CsgD family transcriptional regulator
MLELLELLISSGWLVLPLDRQLLSSLQRHAAGMQASPSVYALYLLKTYLDQDRLKDHNRRIFLRLTPRQREVALLISRHHSYPEIARRLFISPHTVRDHAEQVKLAYQVRTRGQLIMELSDIPEQYFSLSEDADLPNGDN